MVDSATSGGPSYETLSGESASPTRRRRLRGWHLAAAFVVGIAAGGVGVAGLSSDGERSGALITIGGCDIGPGASCPDADLRNAQLQGVDLRGANLRGANLTGANLDNAVLVGADLSGATIANASLRGTLLSGAKLVDAQIVAVVAPNADLSGADLSGASLYDLTTPTRMFDAVFAGSNIDRVRFQEVAAWNANFRGAELRNVIFDEASLSKADFTDARFSGVSKMQYSSLGGINFTRARLTGLSGLSTSYLVGAIFEDTTMPSSITVSGTPHPGNLVYTGIDSVPRISSVNGKGEGSAYPPFIQLTGMIGGTSAVVEVTATAGCIAFRTQTKTFETNVYDGKLTNETPLLEREFTWYGPSLASNMCIGSKYSVRMRSRDDAGNLSSWSPSTSVTLG